MDRAGGAPRRRPSSRPRRTRRARGFVTARRSDGVNTTVAATRGRTRSRTLLSRQHADGGARGRLHRQPAGPTRHGRGRRALRRDRVVHLRCRPLPARELFPGEPQVREARADEWKRRSTSTRARSSAARSRLSGAAVARASTCRAACCRRSTSCPRKRLRASSRSRSGSTATSRCSRSARRAALRSTRTRRAASSCCERIGIRTYTVVQLAVSVLRLMRAASTMDRLRPIARLAAHRHGRVAMRPLSAASAAR